MELHRLGIQCRITKLLGTKWYEVNRLIGWTDLSSIKNSLKEYLEYIDKMLNEELTCHIENDKR